MECGKQPCLYLGLRERLVAVWRQQALAGGQDGALAVALDTAAFEDKVEMLLVVSVQYLLGCHSSANAIVELGAELLAPAVELEVEQVSAVWCEQGDEPVVASPCVVGGRFAERDAPKALDRQGFREQGANTKGLWCDDDKLFACCDFPCHFNVATGNLLQHRFPVCRMMRPCQLHSTLFVPLCGQEDRSVGHRGILFEGTKIRNKVES